MKKKNKICPICHKLKIDVETREDPFIKELYNEVKDYYSCYDCYHERRMDV